MVVSFDGRASEPVMGKPSPLFRDEYDFGLGITTPNYDVTPDGRFLMLRREAQAGHLRLVLNWTEELKRTLAKGASPDEAMTALSSLAQSVRRVGSAVPRARSSDASRQSGVDEEAR
jgi:hypothetical protein